MSPTRLILSFLLSLLLTAGSLLSPAGLLARELPGSDLSAPSAPAGGAAALAAEAPNLDVTHQGFVLLLDRYVQPLSPADLLNAAYTGLVKSLTDAGVAVKSPGPLSLDPNRDKAWTTYQGAVNTLLQESPPPADFSVNAVAISAMARWVDESHTAFLTPQQYADFLAFLRGDVRYGGIGIRPTRPGVTVAEVFPGSPAEATGLMRGDMIIAVDGQPTEGKTLEQIAQQIRGPEGTAVTLAVDRPRTGEHLSFVIVRASIKIEYITTDVVQNNIGYVRLRGFPEQSVADRFEQFLDTLPSIRPRGLVIDLRGNSGGRIDVGLRLLNRFIASGPLFVEQDRSGRRRVQSATGPGLDYPLPIAILMDEGTASMGEIFAAAMRERMGARLIGTQTAGSVAAAQVFPLSDGSAMQITIEEIFSGNGAPLNRTGISPDTALASSTDELQQGRDIPLEAAVLYVWDQSAKAAGVESAGQ